MYAYGVCIDLCGEEVLGDYPHDEVKNPGVNHFPDGVFQKCLKLMQKEKEAERERLKKIKRQRNNAKDRMKQRNDNVILPTTDPWETDGLGGDPLSPAPIVARAAPIDNFDTQWDMALSQPSSSVAENSAARPPGSGAFSPARPSAAAGNRSNNTGSPAPAPGNANGSPMPPHHHTAVGGRGNVQRGQGGQGRGAGGPARGQGRGGGQARGQGRGPGSPLPPHHHVQTNPNAVSRATNAR